MGLRGLHGFSGLFSSYTLPEELTHVSGNAVPPSGFNSPTPPLNPGPGPGSAGDPQGGQRQLLSGALGFPLESFRSSWITSPHDAVHARHCGKCRKLTGVRLLPSKSEPCSSAALPLSSSHRQCLPGRKEEEAVFPVFVVHTQKWNTTSLHVGWPEGQSRRHLRQRDLSMHACLHVHVNPYMCVCMPACLCRQSSSRPAGIWETEMRASVP